MSIKVYQFISLALVGSTFAVGAYDFSDLNNLGNQITRQVHEQVAPLQNLGARISASVNEQLEPIRNDFSDLNNLGNQITRQVHEQVAPLQNLGARISASVNEQLEPIRNDFSNLNNLGDQITRQVNEQLAPLQNLGARISASVNEQLEPIRNGRFFYNAHNNINREYVASQKPFIQPYQPFTGPNLDLSGLNNLGQQIQQSVYQGLEPVRALAITTKMKNGIGGITIATHLPEGKKFIITNNQINQCDGSVSDDGKCSGSLTPFKLNDKKDYCYNKQGFTVVNNHICIGASSVSVINGEIICTSSLGTPALLITLDEYKKLCEGVSTSVEYRYIANPQDPNHVEIPNQNKYVKCSNNEPGVCVFTETNAATNYNGNVVINSYSSGIHVVG